MRMLIMSIMFLLSLFLSAQPPRDEAELLCEVNEIMDTLGIKKRSLVHWDAPIKYGIDTTHISLLGGSLKGARMHLGPKGCDSVYYVYATMYLSPLADSILRATKSASYINEVLCESTLAHEYGHYLQVAEADSSYNLNETDHKKILRHAVEFEGSAIGAYYFMKRMRPKSFRQIMTLPLTNYQKMVVLIIEFHYQKTGERLSPDIMWKSVSQ